MAPLPLDGVALLVFLAGLMPAVAEGGTAEDRALGFTMIGGIFFFAGLYYLTHVLDHDIRRTAWRFISDTISIFCAVILFSSINDIFEAIVEDMSIGFKIWLNRLYVAVWYACLCASIAWCSGMGRGLHVRERILKERGGKIGEKEHVFSELQRTKNNLRCCLLFAHVTGFAGIAGWSLKQNQPWYSSSPGHCALLIPEAILWYYVIIKGLRLGRRFMESRFIEKTKDGEMDELIDMAEEQLEDGENDFFGLFMSFLIVNTLRFVVGGTLPNEEGSEGSATFHHSGLQTFLMYLLALFFLVLAHRLLTFKRDLEKTSSGTSPYLALSNKIWSCSEVKEIDFLRQEGAHTLERMLILSVNVITMSFAWCLMYATQWFLAPYFLEEELVLGIVLAMTISTLSATFVCVLDHVADKKEETEAGEQAGEVYRKLIESFGMLVGFAWEKSFDAALEGVAGEDNKWLKPLLGLMTVLCMLPLWRSHVIPMETEHGYLLGILPKTVHGRFEAILSPKWRDDALVSTVRYQFEETLVLMAKMDRGLLESFGPETQRLLRESLGRSRYEPPAAAGHSDGGA